MRVKEGCTVRIGFLKFKAGEIVTREITEQNANLVEPVAVIAPEKQEEKPRWRRKEHHGSSEIQAET